MNRNLLTLYVVTVVLAFACWSDLSEGVDIHQELRFISVANPIHEAGAKRLGQPSVFAGISSELELVSLALMRSYQVALSSQQDTLRVCVFTPSCSRFGIAAIRRYGFFVGWLTTLDRLQRCHTFASKYYPLDPSTDKLWDPVEAYCEDAETLGRPQTQPASLKSDPDSLKTSETVK